MTGRRKRPPELDLSSIDPVVRPSAADGFRIKSAPDQFGDVITDRKDLKHTGYVELCPSPLRKSTFWNIGSLYYTEATFGLLIPAIEVFESCDTTGPHELGAGTFDGMIRVFASLSRNLEVAKEIDDIDPYWFSLPGLDAESVFQGSFEAMTFKFAYLTGKTSDQLRLWRESADKIFVLGL